MIAAYQVDINCLKRFLYERLSSTLKAAITVKMKDCHILREIYREIYCSIRANINKASWCKLDAS